MKYTFTVVITDSGLDPSDVARWITDALLEEYGSDDVTVTPTSTE